MTGVLEREPPCEYAPAELLLAAAKGDRAAESALLAQNKGLIISIARRFMPRASDRGIDFEDLLQLGSIGFLKAVRDFDTSYNTALSTYAVPKIIGEIRRFLRDDGLIKVGRSAREGAYRINAAREDLSSSLGREPTLSELAAQTGMEPTEIAAAAEATNALDGYLASLDDEDSPTFRTAGCAGQEAEIVEKISLGEAVSKLPPRERAVISLRFSRSLTQTKTAELLGISQVQVSRLEKKAISKLKSLLSQGLL